MTPSAYEDEQGVALVFALAFIALFGLGIAALLGFTSTGALTVTRLAEHDAELYSANAVIDQAVEAVRMAVDADLDPVSACPLAEDLETLNSVELTVSCEAVASGPGVLSAAWGAIGDMSTFASDGAMAPDQAILTLATGNEVGLGQRSSSGTSVLNVLGDVLSGSPIDIGSNATLNVAGAAAAPRCSGTITATDGVDCASSTRTIDSGYASRATETPELFTPATLPACALGGGPVVFQPDRTYEDGQALTDLMSGDPKKGCPGATFHFPPGVYYFDFVDAGSHVWTINDAKAHVVGGVLTGTTCDRNGGGVQFIFGRDSRLNVADGTLALCAERAAGEQSIAIYGTPATAAPAEPQPTEAVLTSDAGTSAIYTPLSSAFVIDGESASAAIPKENPGARASLKLTGFASAADAIPVGSEIHAVTATVTHRESIDSGPNSGIKSLTGTVRSPSGTALAVFQPAVCAAATSCTWTGELSGLRTVADLAAADTVEYVATAKNNTAGTSWLDGISLKVAYTPPAIRATSGCAAAGPYPVEFDSDSDSVCTVFRTSGNARVLVEGTVYIPDGAVNVQVPNGSEAGVPGPDDAALLLKRGVISRILRVKIAAGKQTFSPIQLPTPECSDLMDNDGDGKTDFPSDPGCTSTTDDSEADTVLPQCSDGIDNDGDSFIDHPADPGCTDALDNDETDGLPQCSDGIDNDGDSFIDHPADPGCTDALDNDETDAVPQCSDGEDNDGDGLTDHPADPGCTGPLDDDETDLGPATLKLTAWRGSKDVIVATIVLEKWKAPIVESWIVQR